LDKYFMKKVKIGVIGAGYIGPADIEACSL
jgi:hypothetical protein